MSNKVSLSLAVCVATMSVSGIAYASSMQAPIEGWTPEAATNNATLLKSVIKMDSGKFFSKTTCSSTLISKNILLTAKHCVAKITAGTRISLNDNPAYEVVAVVQQPKMAVTTTAAAASADGKTLTALPLPSKETSTDVAMVLFKSTDCSTSTLGGVEPLKLANAQVKAGLSNKVLIAGYGLTAPGGSDAGTLHAGYNEWTVSDYSVTADPKMADLVKAVARSKRIPEDSLIMMGDRDQMLAFINTKGQKISSSLTNLTAFKQPEGALPLPGDSGSAAIAFDSKNNPYVVGVTSMADPNSVPFGASILVVDPASPSKEPIFSADITEKGFFDSEEDLTAKAMDGAMAKLLELKYLDGNDNVLKDFGVLRTSGRAAMGTYASVLNPQNNAFITQGLEQLKKTRDAANYCQ
jgi:hypothetical protein